MKKTFKVTLRKSLIGCTQNQKDTARCLKLRTINDFNTINDTPANRGQIFKIQHLLDVQVEK